MNTRKPQFLVIGGSRCGTTTIHAALERHPEVFVPPEKSPNFFTAPDMEKFPGSAAMAAMKGHTVKTEGDYLRLFQSAPHGKIRGEVSPVYLQSIYTADRVRQFVPEAKIVAILRNPVDRAFAHFIGRRRDGLEPLESFEEAIAAELADPSPKKLAFNNYLAIGKYGHFLAPWFEEFPRERIKILFFDDFVVRPLHVLNDLFAFLGVAEVEADFSIDRKNQSGLATNPLLRGVWTRTALVRAKLRAYLPKVLRDSVGRIFLGSMEKPKFPDQLRAMLVQYYAADMDDLEQLTSRKLDAWRQSPQPIGGRNL